MDDISNCLEPCPICGGQVHMSVQISGRSMRPSNNGVIEFEAWGYAHIRIQCERHDEHTRDCGIWHIPQIQQLADDWNISARAARASTLARFLIRKGVKTLAEIREEYSLDILPEQTLEDCELIWLFGNPGRYGEGRCMGFRDANGYCTPCTQCKLHFWHPESFGVQEENQA